MLYNFITVHVHPCAALLHDPRDKNNDKVKANIMNYYYHGGRILLIKDMCLSDFFCTQHSTIRMTVQSPELQQCIYIFKAIMLKFSG